MIAHREGFVRQKKLRYTNIDFSSKLQIHTIESLILLNSFYFHIYLTICVAESKKNVVIDRNMLSIKLL